MVWKLIAALGSFRLLRPAATPRLGLLAALLLVSPAAGFGVECGGRGGPSATLLIPYFEVDLGEPAGRTTLFSIANADPAATVARAVLWTNSGIPTLAFDVLIPGDGVVAVNLRDVFAGRLPVTGDGDEPPVGLDVLDLPPGCTFPLALPTLDGEKGEDLRARHTGTPSSDGLCHGEPNEEGLATGYVTVDVVDGCMAEGRVPGDSEPYFAGEGIGGLAAERNVLWGDVFLVDSAGNRAEGLQAVAIPADAATEGGPTFYGQLAEGGADRRRPLPHLYRTRFLAGPGTATELILWSGNLGKQPLPPTDGECHGAPGSISDPAFFVRGWSESSEESFETTLSSRRHSLRIPVGEAELDVPVPFGSLELEFWINCHICSPPNSGPLQSWVGTLMGAEGRFATGVEAQPLGPCSSGD